MFLSEDRCCSLLRRSMSWFSHSCPTTCTSGVQKSSSSKHLVKSPTVSCVRTWKLNPKRNIKIAATNWPFETPVCQKSRCSHIKIEIDFLNCATIVAFTGFYGASLDVVAGWNNTSGSKAPRIPRISPTNWLGWKSGLSRPLTMYC